MRLATCSECGGNVPSDARTLGLCPRCLMRSALLGGSGGGRGGLGGTEAPEAEELRELLAGLDVIELIGRGGMGFVYKARQRSLDRLVAVKLFPREAHDDPSFAERFANESKILASLSHPGIVAAYEFGESERSCHLVMELIPGHSLRLRIEAGPVPAGEAIAIATQVCDALEYAHGRGVIHRDVKPENILLEDRADEGGPRVRVADFGLAKLLRRGPTDYSMTAPNRLMGTPDYMAPEQRQRPGAVDARADVYALGVVLYEMLTGQLPLGRFAPPTADARVNRVVMRCLETDPARRYASAAQLRRDLAALAAPRPVLVRAIAAIVALLIVAIGALAIAHFWPRNKPDDPPPPQRATAPPLPATASASAPTTARAVVPTRIPTVVTHADPPPVAIAIPDRSADLWPRNGLPPRIPMGPNFERMPTGPDAFYERMVRDHGANRVVRIFVDDLPGDVRDHLLQRLKELTGATSTMVSGNDRSLSIQLAPVRDLEGLAKQIDFGTVAAVDPAKRVIEVIADPAKLPAPKPKPTTRGRN